MIHLFALYEILVMVIIPLRDTFICITYITIPVDSPFLALKQKPIGFFALKYSFFNDSDFKMRDCFDAIKHVKLQGKSVKA